MGDLESGGYDNAKGPRDRRGRRGRRAGLGVGRIATAVLLLMSFALPFSFLLISERGKRLPHSVASTNYEISRPDRTETVAEATTAGGSDQPPPSKTKPAPKRSPVRGKGGAKSGSGTPHQRPSRARAGDSDAMAITGVSASGGPTVGGTVVTITGRNLGLPGSIGAVLIGQTPCERFDHLSQTEVACVVPPGTGQGLPVAVRGAEGIEAAMASSWSYDPPSVGRVSPSHASARGGALVTIEGKNFGAFESHPIAWVGGEPCLSTAWVSDAMVTCEVPPGRGSSLPVQVTVCGCGGSHAHNQTSSGSAGSAMDALAGFTYDEDAVLGGHEAVLAGIDLDKLRRVEISMNQRLVNLKYEMRVPDVVTGETLYFAVVPELVPVLPKRDERFRSDACAVVGGSGSLAGSGLGDEIDAHDAVFRIHDAPTQGHEQDVGAKTTFQVLSPFWAGELLKHPEGKGVAWLHSDANVLLWSSASQEQFLELRERYQDQKMTLLNPQFSQSVASAAAVMQPRIERAMGTEFGRRDGPSSALVAALLAAETCDKVDLYGLDMRQGKRYLYYKGHEAPQAEREASSLEYLIYLVLQSAGRIREVKEGGQVQPPPPPRRRSPAGPKPGSLCEFRECNTDCNDRGIFANGTCHCDPIYSGPDCGVSRLEEEAVKIFSGLNLTYGGSLVLNRAEVNGTTIKLPDGITRNKFGKNGDVYNVDRMLYHVIPEQDTRERFATCAIVGNSGSLLRQERGHEIDAHEMVYRFNQAPLKGYEKHVGSRCTHESLNGYWVKQVLDERRGFKWNWRQKDTEMVVFELFEPGAFGWKAKTQIVEKDAWWRQSYVRLKQKHQNRRITALSPYFVSWSYQMYRDLRRRFQRSRLGRYPGEKPMSGFYAFFYALQVCDEVDVYGFAPWRDPADKHLPKGTVIVSKDRYHYFDSARPRPGSHSFDLALYIYRLFAIHYDNVRIYE